MSDPDETQPLEPTSEDDDLATRSSAVDWDNPLRSAPKAVVILIVALLVIVGLVLWAAWRDRSNLASEVDDLETNNEELASGVEALRGQVEGLGAEPVVVLDRDPDEDQPTVVDPDDPETQDPETQDPERDDPEIQDPERDDPDPNDPDRPNDPDPDDPETQDAEVDDPDSDDPEIQDPEVDDPEPDDPEIQDPEIDDPDPSIPGPAGPAGVGIANVRVVETSRNECHLIVTLTDGKVIDAGEVGCPRPIGQGPQ